MDDAWPHNHVVNYLLLIGAQPPQPGPPPVALAPGSAAPPALAGGVATVLPAPASPPPLPPPHLPPPVVPAYAAPRSLVTAALLAAPGPDSASSAASNWRPASSWTAAAALTRGPEEPDSLGDIAAAPAALRLRLKKKTAEWGAKEL